MTVHADEILFVLVAFYLLWCGTGGVLYSSFTRDNIQHFFPFVAYYHSRVCIMVLQHFCLVMFSIGMLLLSLLF